MKSIFDYSLTKRSQEGARMVFKDTDTGEPVLFQGKGDKEPRECFLVLLGPEAGEFARVFAQMQERAAKRKGRHSMSDAESEAARIADSRAIARLVIGGELFDGKAWFTVDSESAGDVLYQVGPLRAQAIDFVTTAGNYTAGKGATMAA